MNLPEEGCLLRIFVGDSKRHEGKPLYDYIVRQAREQGLAGATVFRGMMGFGASSRIHTSKILRLSEDLPVLIEIVDTRGNLESFLKRINPMVKDGLVTLEKAQVQIYRSNKQTDR